jgi:hypothetical protein
MKVPNDDGGIRSAAAGEGLAGLFTLAALLGHAMDQGLAERGLTRARGEVIWTLVELTELGTRTASEWGAGYHEFAATLFADLATPQLTDFVSALSRVLAQLRDAVPTRPGDTG